MQALIIFTGVLLTVLALLPSCSQIAVAPASCNISCKNVFVNCIHRVIAETLENELNYCRSAKDSCVVLCGYLMTQKLLKNDRKDKLQ